jgi:glycosyltransferase involved in cell wall biosynthesis
MKFLTMTIHTGGHGAFDRQRRVARALVRAGHDVIWLAPGLDEPGEETFLPIAPTYHWLPGVFGWLLRLRSALRAHRSFFQDVDAVFTVREYDTLACLLDFHVRRLPHVFFMHGDTYECEKFQARFAFHWRQRLRSFVTALLYPSIQRFIMPRVQRIVVIAQFLADHLRGRISAKLPEITVIVNDAIPPAPQDPSEQELGEAITAFRPKNGILIGVIAQIYFHGKGFDIFLEAMNLLKHEDGIRAIVIGYGSEEEAVSKYIREHNLEDKVLFLGRSRSAQSYMAQFDLVVAATRFCDGWPMVVLEALQTERCVLASDIEAHSAQLVHKQLLFPNGDYRELARRILELRDNPAARDRNRALVRDRRTHFHFDWDGQVIDVLETIGSDGAQAQSSRKPGLA